jgi:serine/threonine-protein kinase
MEHPNIRRIYAAGEAGGYLYYAMELVEGETLQDKIDRHAQLPEADCLRWAAQIASAMDYYGRRNVLHRDIRPSNIFIAKDNRALLCDVGLSHRVYEDYALSAQGAPLGAPWYVSPELGLGTGQLDIRSDLYSLGITLFHCLTGRLPFFGGNAGVIISKHAREPLPDVRRMNAQVSRGTVALIERMCAKRPEERHQSPRELLAELTWLRSGIGGGGTPIVPLDPPDRAELEAQIPKKQGFWKKVLRLFGGR